MQVLHSASLLLNFLVDLVGYNVGYLALHMTVTQCYNRRLKDYFVVTWGFLYCFIAHLVTLSKNCGFVTICLMADLGLYVVTTTNKHVVDTPGQLLLKLGVSSVRWSLFGLLCGVCTISNINKQILFDIFINYLCTADFESAGHNFFMQAKHFFSHFEGLFRVAQTFLIFKLSRM